MLNKTPSFILMLFATAFATPAMALTQNAFPTTIADVPRDIRKDNQTAGYKPFENASAYQSIEKLETEEEATERMMQELEAQYQLDSLTLSDTEYCAKYFDENRCPEDRNGPGYLIEMAGGKASDLNLDTPRNNDRATTSRAATRARTSNTITARTADNNSQPFASFWQPNSPRPTTAKSEPTTTKNTDLSPTNNTKHNGPCTPSAKSIYFPNKILTTGKYENVDPAFEKAMIQNFRVEGKCGKHQNDAGGYTCYGLSSRFNPDINFRTLTRAKAEDIIYDRYYTAKNTQSLPDSIRGDVFRINFNAGSNNGTQRLQKILGLKQTGTIDDTLINAVHNYKGNLHDAFWDDVRNYYVEIVRKKPKRKTFLKGWMRSVNLFRENGCHTPTTAPIYR